MNSQKVDLALAFLQSQPGSAAAVLEQQPIEHVALFLTGVPHTKAAIVLSKMLPAYTARLCKHLEPAVCAGFLSSMEINLVAAILRHLDKGTKKKVLELLPEKTKLACKFLLDYSEDAVGAWMITNVTTLPNDCNVQEALSRIAMEQNVVDLDTVYVVDRERRLHGVVSVSSLLKATPDALISAVMKSSSNAISGRSSMVSASNDAVWVDSETVAVINKNRQMVGVLRHMDLRKGLHGISATINQSSGHDPITGICEVYGNSLLALLNTVADASGVNRP